MRVISLIRRTQGHNVTLDEVTYAFLPPDWACEVQEPRHLARFRAIQEGYRVVEDSQAEPLPAPVPRPRGRPRRVRPVGDA
jgi:glyoxylate utilization-related uncharacterized protein